MSLVVMARAGAALPAGVTAAPPAVEGDVLRALERGATTIVLAARGVPAPWPEELAAALARGARVIVAGEAAHLSLELGAHGVEGVGELALRAQELSDDELHFPTEADPSDAWLPADLEEATRRCGLDPALVAAHRAQAPRSRSLRLALEQTPVLDVEAAIARLAGVERASARDLAAALARAAEARPPPATFELPRTAHLERLAHQVWMERALAPGEEPPYELVTAAGETYAVSRKKVLLRLLARGEARRLGIGVKPAEVEAFASDWRKRFRFERASELQSYLEGEGVSVEAFMQIMEDFALLVRLEAAYDGAIREEMRAHVAVQAARGRT